MRTKRILLSFAFAGVMCSGVLPGTSNDAFAWYCGPGDTICIGSWCEPVTTQAARAICPLRRRGGGSPRGSGTRPQPGGKQVGTVNKFRSNLSHQIKPLRCPKAAPYAITETAYGGTMCATAAQMQTLQQIFRNLPGAGQGAAQAAQPNQDLPGAGQGAAQGTQPNQAQTATAQRELAGLTNELNGLLKVPPEQQSEAQQRRITEIMKRLKDLAQMTPQR
jgi:hypothetical protein